MFDGNQIMERLALALVKVAGQNIGDLGGETSDIEVVLRRAADIAQTMAVHDCSNCPIAGECPVRQQLKNNEDISEPNEEGGLSPDGDYDLNQL
jgi:hypothetical protein